MGERAHRPPRRHRSGGRVRAALLVLLVALASPLDDGADRNLPWHMVQHLLLLAVAAPLLAVSEPVVVMLRALPDRAAGDASQPVVAGSSARQTSVRGWLVWMVGCLRC